jgi:hypothetical protein
MPDAGHVPIPIEDWRGIFDRGISDIVPGQYFEDSLNVKFNETDVYTRDGSTLLLTAPDLIRFSVYKRLGETPRYIWLNKIGQIYDSLFPNTPIWTDPLFVDFSMRNFNNRAYITPHNRRVGIPGRHVLVYSGSGAARLAGGAAPEGFTLGAANSGTAGNVEAGIHLFSVCFESDTGYLTAPGPATFPTLVTPGNRAVLISNIPPLPSGMVAVRILATSAIQEYNGDQDGYEFFIVSTDCGGRVVGNATSATVNFYDVQLVASATYLFDNRGLIPAGVAICEYNGRMCIGGIDGDEHSIYISAPYDPEQMSAVSGYVTVDPFESGSGISNLFPFRGQLIICKPGRIYAVMDNQDEPVTWKTPETVDVGAGTECFGVGLIADAKSQQNDRAWIATTSGLVLFEGYMRQPEASWLVKGVWDRINKKKFNLVQVSIDPEFKQIFVVLPLDGSQTNNYILYGYYGTAHEGGGFDIRKIKWSLWHTDLIFSTLTVDTDPATNCNVLKYSGVDGNIYKLDHGFSVHNDNALLINSYVQTALYTVKSNYTQHCNLINLRVLGNGILKTSLHGLDGIDSSQLKDLTMSASIGKSVQIKANFISERVSIKFKTGDNTDEFFKLIRADFYLKPMWISAPA